jgi:D-tyrosyl-tRNA(Tyr) deacylase
MRILVQRVSRASVTVEGEVIGSTGPGLLALVGFKVGDGEEQVRTLSRKLVNLRVFEDADGKMNLSLLELGLECLAISQFTLYGDTQKGNRPSFVMAERPEKATVLYDAFVHELRALLGATSVAQGKFGAMMKVELVNEGPVTLMLEA